MKKIFESSYSSTIFTVLVIILCLATRPPRSIVVFPETNPMFNITTPTPNVNTINYSIPQVTFHNLSAPFEHANNTMDCVLVKRPEARFYICLHENKKDFFSKSIRENQANARWGYAASRKLQNLVRKFPDAVFLDIGAHIGWNSLYTAALGAKVVAVEPNVENHHHLHKAVRLSNFKDNFILITDAISDRIGAARMSQASNNTGHSFLATKLQPAINGSSFNVSTITLDQLIPVVLQWSRRSVVKIGVEGHECVVFRNSSNFLKSINVPYVLMEWAVSKSDAACTDAMIRTFELSGYELQDDQGKKIPVKILKNKNAPHGVMNIAWKRKHE